MPGTVGVPCHADGPGGVIGSAARVAPRGRAAVITGAASAVQSAAGWASRPVTKESLWAAPGWA